MEVDAAAIVRRAYNGGVLHKPNGCHEWLGATNGRYPQVKIGGRRGKVLYLHRLSFMSSHGELRPGMYVLHRCDNPKCINAEHLFAGTQADNIRDCVAKGRHNGWKKKCAIQ